MNWWVWLIIIAVAIVITKVIFKKVRKDELSLDDRIGGVKGFWDKCCAKVKGMVGV